MHKCFDLFVIFLYNSYQLEELFFFKSPSDTARRLLAINHSNCAKCEMAAHLQTVITTAPKFQCNQYMAPMSLKYLHFTMQCTSIWYMYFVHRSVCRDFVLAFVLCVICAVCPLCPCQCERCPGRDLGHHSREVGKTKADQQLSSLQSRVPPCGAV